MSSNRKIAIGDTFDRLTVKSIDHSKKTGCTYYICECACGNVKSIRASHLGRSITSCGCLQKQTASERMKGQKYREKPEGASSMHIVYLSYKHRAKQKNRIFEITEDEFKELTSKPCYYCGTLPAQQFKSHNSGRNGIYTYNGLDRIDSSRGYSLDNVVPCCGICNVAKNTLLQEDFYKWANNLYNNLKTMGAL